MSNHPTAHRSHDYRYLIQRWKLVAKKAGLTGRVFHHTTEWPVYLFVSKPARKVNERPCLYFSAGVHGDEPAPPWGLLEWAEENPEVLAQHPFLIYPCINPYGLVNNLRRDEAGIDINRNFHRTDDPLIAAWQKSMLGRQVQAAFHLHEDYDAQGIYLYELHEGAVNYGHRVLEACAEVIPQDRRPRIEGRRADAGLILPRRIPKGLPGLPEAIALHNMGSRVTMTFESPSEFGLIDRINVHKKFIQSVLHQVCGL